MLLWFYSLLFIEVCFWVFLFVCFTYLLASFLNVWLGKRVSINIVGLLIMLFESSVLLVFKYRLTILPRLVSSDPPSSWVTGVHRCAQPGLSLCYQGSVAPVIFYLCFLFLPLRHSPAKVSPFSLDIYLSTSPNTLRFLLYMF